MNTVKNGIQIWTISYFHNEGRITGYFCPQILVKRSWRPGAVLQASCKTTILESMDWS